MVILREKCASRMPARGHSESVWSKMKSSTTIRDWSVLQETRRAQPALPRGFRHMSAAGKKAGQAGGPAAILGRLIAATITLGMVAAASPPAALGQTPREKPAPRSGSELLIPENAPIRSGQGQRVNVTDGEN